MGAKISDNDIVFPFEEQAIGEKCPGLALDIVNRLVFSQKPNQRQKESREQIRERIEDFLDFANDLSIRVQDRAVMQAAAARNIPVIRRADRLFQLGYGHLQKRMSATKTSCTDVISNDIAANKDYSRRIVGDLGLPVPRYQRVRNAREAVQAAEEIGYPVVVKPNNGGMGRGVSIGMKDAKQVREAYKLACRWGRSCLVEEFVRGSDYRLLIINNRMIAASERVPAHVRGDGKKTIAELVEQTNLDPRRGPGQEFPWTHLQLDKKADRLLQELGYTHNTIPKKDEVVFLRRNANTSDGGTAADITDRVHPDNRKIAERAVQAIGLDIAGIDLLTTDISRSMWETGGRICEINSRPGLRKHMWPAEGTPRDVTGPIMDMLFPSGSDGRIPVVTVLTDGHSRLCSAMLAHMLEIDGRTTGLLTRDGITVNRDSYSDNPTSRAAAVNRLLLDPTVQAAVVEVTPDEIVQGGLGYDQCTAGAFFNQSLPDQAADEKSGSSKLLLARRVLTKASKHKVVLLDGQSVDPATLNETESERLTVVLPDNREITDKKIINSCFRLVTLNKTVDGPGIEISERNKQSVKIPVRGLLAQRVSNPAIASDILMSVALAIALNVNIASITKGVYCYPKKVQASGKKVQLTA